MKPAYYNENDEYAVKWLRALIAAGHIAPGDVDERSIVDVRPDDLKGYAQCHFFAGIGGWSYVPQVAEVFITAYLDHTDPHWRLPRSAQDDARSVGALLHHQSTVLGPA